MRKFLEDTLLSGTTHPIYICSVPNPDRREGEAGERRIVSRDVEAISRFLTRWDREGRGCYFAVSTIEAGHSRRKENAREAAFLHVDVDLKDVVESADEILLAVQSLPLPPSRVHASGNGFHCFWVFPSPETDVARVGVLLRQLFPVVSGDASVAHSVALLRAVGTHNTKGGDWKEVRVVHDSGARYSVDELELWLAQQRPVLHSRQAPAPEAEDNPFTSAAKLLSFKPPIDVGERLASMRHRGEGDQSIHTTQLSVTASMLASGTDVDDVVATVLAATREVGEASWNWAQEERAIRGMCDDWVRKRERDAKPVARPAVVNLSAHREEKERRQEQEEARPEGEEPPHGKPKKGVLHVVLGQGILGSLKKRGESLLITGEQVWRCQEGLWQLMAPGEARAWIEREAEEGCRALKVTSTQKIISETRSWIYRNPEVYVADVPWDQHGKIATLSGLVDPRTLEVVELSAEHFATNQIDCEFDPRARCPNWEQMLRDCFPGDDETVSIVQEVFGVALLHEKPRQLMRALVLVGPSNCGKSNILNVMAGLLTDKPNTTPFDTLENPHGLMEFLRRAPWVLHEAFDQSKWHFSSAVKALLSGDPVNVNVKNGPIVAHKFSSPVFWGTNSPPQFKEASKAIENRLKIVHCHVVFSMDDPTGAAVESARRGYANPSSLVLEEEREGVLNWAIAGMQRAVARGYFTDTAEMVKARRELAVEGNLVAGFFEECAHFDADRMVSVQDFFAAFTIWWQENRGEGRSYPASNSIGKALATLADRKVAMDRTEIRYNQHRFYAGLSLNATGLDMWSAAFNAGASRGDSMRISSRVEDVNREIPPKWSDKVLIRQMREAQAQWRAER